VVASGNGYFSLTELPFLRADSEHSHLASSIKLPVEQGGGDRVLNLLGDIFLRSQNLTDKEFISKLEQRGIEFTVRRLDTGTYIEVGRFGYRFNEQGQSRGGWVRNYSQDRTSDWENWAALLNEPTQ
jgi:hypothetical protein